MPGDAPKNGPEPQRQVRQLAAETYRQLSSLALAPLAFFLESWPQDAVWHAAAAPCALPVLSYLPQAAREAPDFSRPLCECLSAAAAQLAWRQSYRSGEAEPSFLERYGWCELVGPSGVLGSEQLACGFLLLGPQTHYPSHRHEAQELYLPLSGTAHWCQSAFGWQSRPPGTLIQHAAFEPHAMRTGESPLLALYLWRGRGLHTTAALLR